MSVCKLYWIMNLKEATLHTSLITFSNLMQIFQQWVSNKTNILKLDITLCCNIFLWKCNNILTIIRFILHQKICNDAQCTKSILVYVQFSNYPYIHFCNLDIFLEILFSFSKKDFENKKVVLGFLIQRKKQYLAWVVMLLTKLNKIFRLVRMKFFANKVLDNLNVT